MGSESESKTSYPNLEAMQRTLQALGRRGKRFPKPYRFGDEEVLTTNGHILIVAHIDASPSVAAEAKDPFPHEEAARTHYFGQTNERVVITDIATALSRVRICPELRPQYRWPADGDGKTGRTMACDSPPPTGLFTWLGRTWSRVYLSIALTALSDGQSCHVFDVGHFERESATEKRSPIVISSTSGVAKVALMPRQTDNDKIARLKKSRHWMGKDLES